MGTFIWGKNPTSAKALAQRIVVGWSEPALEIEVSRVIAAPRQDLYEYIKNMENMGEISPENKKTTWITPGKRKPDWCMVSLGMTGVVEEDVPGESFGFLTDSPSETHWRYTFSDAPGGTRVVESMRKARPQLSLIVTAQELLRCAE
ncbi:SRPBCC family protein [Corynebacterium oculi]|uniref:Polyketide cyclase / dehydrase and lipid transport n=1 Tax=Corynebacterium oculi TaxID=1544416 RepID=A0A0Q1DZE7_9CORY|nr:SRPBCC family protein [Corynebacterium oculi]KQB85629.1 Polyketide cyclase / dehydrase and lipid transport [Corynebacterium oculi]